MSGPIYEIANLSSKSGSGDEFARQLEKGSALIAADPTCHGVVTHRGIEDPDSFVLVIGWDSVDAHNNFRDSESMARFVGYIEKLLGGAPAFAHYNVIDDAK
jgi:quinol monooxygenase YgiN